MSLTFADLIMCVEDHAEIEGLEPVEVLNELMRHFVAGIDEDADELDQILAAAGIQIVDIH